MNCPTASLPANRKTARIRTVGSTKEPPVVSFHLRALVDARQPVWQYLSHSKAVSFVIHSPSVERASHSGKGLGIIHRVPIVKASVLKQRPKRVFAGDAPRSIEQIAVPSPPTETSQKTNSLYQVPIVPVWRRRSDSFAPEILREPASPISTVAYQPCRTRGRHTKRRLTWQLIRCPRAECLHNKCVVKRLSSVWHP